MVSIYPHWDMEGVKMKNLSLMFMFRSLTKLVLIRQYFTGSVIKPWFYALGVWEKWATSESKLDGEALNHGFIL